PPDVNRVFVHVVAEADWRHMRLPIWTDRGQPRQPLAPQIRHLGGGKRAHTPISFSLLMRCSAQPLTFAGPADGAVVASARTFAPGSMGQMPTAPVKRVSALLRFRCARSERADLLDHGVWAIERQEVPATLYRDHLDAWKQGAMLLALVRSGPVLFAPDEAYW